MSKLKVDVEVNDSKVAPGLAKTKASVQKWASDLKGVVAGAFGGAAIGAAIQSTISNLEGVGDASDRMGRTVQEVQMLAQMAQLAGRELGNVEMMLNNIAEAQVDALQGNEAKMATFRAAGFDEQSLRSTNELGVLQQMASAFQGKSMSEMRGIGLTDVIGKKSMGTFAAMQGDLANFFTTLKEGSDKLVDSETILNFKASSDLFSVALTNLTNTLKNTFLPALTFVVNGLTNIVLAFTTLGKSIGAFLGNLMSAEGKGKGIRGFYGDVKRAGSAFIDEWNKGIEEYNAKNRIQAAAKDKLAAAEALSKMGPGTGPQPKPDKSSGRSAPVFNKMPVPDAMTGGVNQVQGNQFLTRGSFLGANTRLAQAINYESISLLKQIEKNTRKIAEANAFNSTLDVLAMLFGITVK